MPTQEITRPACLAALLRGARRPHRALFDGGDAASWGDGHARYSDSPVATLTVYASGWACRRDAAGARWHWGDPFAALDAFVTEARAAYAGADGAGIAAVLSYDLKHAVERLPRRLPWPHTPLLFAALYDWTLCSDYRSGRAWLAAADAARLEARREWLLRRGGDASRATPLPRLAVTPQLSRAAYVEMVTRGLDYIAAGDVYQVNLAQPLDAPLSCGALAALVHAWLPHAPMPFAGVLEGDGWSVVSNSPECLLALDGRDIATFPIKGTRPPERAAELPCNAKEQAEHVMIVDLERNDLGRVCETGSVTVPRLAAVRSFPGVAHLESSVRGVLRDEVGLADLLRAIFPGGSITGAPKIRAMQIIDELEPAPRGFYTGALGWIDFAGRARFNIAIRTATLSPHGMRYWAGGGIVADSDPDREYAETWLKAESLTQALTSLERSAA
jgi:para-aminobenzoate synthetase component 1